MAGEQRASGGLYGGRAAAGPLSEAVQPMVHGRKKAVAVRDPQYFKRMVDRPGGVDGVSFSQRRMGHAVSGGDERAEGKPGPGHYSPDQSQYEAVLFHRLQPDGEGDRPIERSLPERGQSAVSAVLQRQGRGLRRAGPRARSDARSEISEAFGIGDAGCGPDVGRRAPDRSAGRDEGLSGSSGVLQGNRGTHDRGADGGAVPGIRAYEAAAGVVAGGHFAGTAFDGYLERDDGTAKTEFR
ncbi:hypothetical protein D1872_225330 [compost metagenome]